MAKNFVNEGDVIDFVAPSGGVVSGRVAVIANMAVVAVANVASGANAAGITKGTFTFPKASGASTSIAAGGYVYWDNTNSNVTVSATSNTKIGVAPYGAANADTSVTVRFNGLY